MDRLQPERSGKFSWNFALGTATAALLLAAVVIPALRTGDGPSALRPIVLANGIEVDVELEPIFERPELRTGMSVGDLWQLAFGAYTRGDFAAAEPLFARIVDSLPQDTDARKFRGICLVQLRQFDEALRQLALAQEMQVEDSGLADPNIAYYLGVAHVGLGQTDAAIDALRAAGDAGGGIGSAARKLRAELEALGDAPR